MERWLTIVLGLAVTALVVVIGVKSAPPLPQAASAGGGAGDASADALAADAGVFDGGVAADSVDASSPFILLSDQAVDTPREGGAALPQGSPRQVRFGVVLVQYDGAQGASAKARSKKDALELAERLATDAKSDFHSAVQHGDSGSAEDLGFVHRGLLEPAAEQVLFTLPVGAVSDPVDTPRGYWITKRLE
jgi:hypothetical protein